MNGYPRTIESGTGEQLTFLRRVQHDGKERLEVENCVKPGAGPPFHTHHLQEESLTVRKGKIGYQIMGQEPQYAEAGQSVTFTPGVAHKFWNAGDDDLECDGYVTPPDNMEYFLTQIYTLTRESGGKQPNPFDTAYLMHRYKSEFAMHEIPAFVQKVMFPIFRTIGRLTGRYRKYADAPEPVVR